jgi:hypothetical protein
MAAYRASDPSSETRPKTHSEHARRRQRSHVCAFDKMPVALPTEGSAAESTVFHYFDLWNYDGTLEAIHYTLYLKCREAADPDASPTAAAAAIIDSQSVKSAEKGVICIDPQWLRCEQKDQGQGSGIFS